MSDRDCEKCKHHTEKGCDSWDCNFEPCEDAISRQAILDIIKFEYDWLLDAKVHNADTKIAFSGIKSKVLALSPVNPQKPKTDVLDKIRAEILNFKEKCNASDYLGCGILEIIDKYIAESEGEGE